MIGKRSKFKDHEHFQNKEGSDNSSDGVIKKGNRKEIGDSFEEQDSDYYDGGEDEIDGDRFEAENIFETGRKRVWSSKKNEEKDKESTERSSCARSKQHDSTESSSSKRDNEEVKDEVSSKSSPTILSSQGLKSDTDLLWDEICNGVKGKNAGIPMGFNRLNKYLGLRKSIYTTIGASAGCGKTSLVDCAYVLNPYDWYIKNKYTSKAKFEVIYFSMERKKTYKLAKWLCMKIWKEENILMTTDQLLSWQGALGKKEQEIAKFYIDNYFKEMTESGIIKIIDGPQNPTGMYKYLKAHALTKGNIVEVNEFEDRYIPNDDNLITNVVIDHAGKVKLESIGGKYDKKLTIDKMSEYCSWSRDFLGYSPIVISQFNRTSYQDVQFSRKEGNDPDPTVEYWKDSGNIIEDCDVAISLFNPYKYSLEEYMGYQVNDFTDSGGSNKFRGLKIIKNSYGTDNLRIGLGFLGEVSLFKELTKAQDITQKEINSVISNDFFLGF
jgi:hypothetical protein